MATLSVLQTRLETLKAALANGVLTVRHGEDMVTYRSVAEIKTAIGAIEQDIDQVQGKSIIRSVRLTSSKDL